VDFFAFGAPKSGTTWLQSLLDAHPDVCCRPEDQLNQFVGLLPDLLERYNRMREGINERTAQYELTDQFRNSDAAAVFQFIVEIMRRKSQKPIVGTKDNSILEALDMYHTMFDEAKFIHILRDPRDITVSSWHHNMRVEDNFIGRAHNLEEWALGTAKSWVKVLGIVEAIPDRLMTVRFEDLKASGVAEAKKIFDFLGADTSKAADCIEKTRFEKQKKSGNKFYRKGKAGTWREFVDEDLAAAMVDIAGEKMKEYGYVEG
jgi:hypothetical protein